MECWVLMAACLSMPWFHVLGTGERSADPLRPNVVLLMADDLGWADVGFNGNQVVQTPELDAMASEALVFDRFYAAAPVCSPTRGSCLTGRHPYRYGITHANVGHLPESELTLAEYLKPFGYSSGHFGKWHLGTLSLEGRDSNRGGDRHHEHYSPPSRHGFDTYFSTEAKVPTWDPMWRPSGATQIWWDPVEATKRKPYGTAYWNSKGRIEQGVDGDDSALIMSQALAFMETAQIEDKPFLAVIWFHAPHLPVVAGKQWSEPYASLGAYHRHYYGCITAMDAQIGRLRSFLQQKGLSDHTMLWFCSDNGPEGKSYAAPGSAMPFQGRKRSLLEGGIRVPAMLEWPSMITEARRTNLPAVTSDYLPTVADFLGEPLPDRPYDGLSLRPVIENVDSVAHTSLASRSIGFQSGNQGVWMRGTMKYYAAENGTQEWLFDLSHDAREARNLASTSPTVLKSLRSAFLDWQASCLDSLQSQDR